MGIPQKSRKGKKAWRQNIDDGQVVEAVQQETHQARRGPAVHALSDDQLFFVDRGPTADPGQPRHQQAQPASAGRRAGKGPRAAMRQTRAQLILQAPHAIQPVVPLKAPKRKPGVPKLRHALTAAAGSPRPGGPQPPPQPAPSDPWEEAERPGRAPRVVPASAVGPSARQRRHGIVPVPRIPAVEVDAAGCSYNPEFDAHQEALAVLVASEHCKVLRKELARPGVPSVVLGADGGGRHGDADELARLLVRRSVWESGLAVPMDVSPEDLVEEDGEQSGGGHADHKQGGDPHGGSQLEAALPVRVRLAEKKTKKDRARAARAAAEAQAVAERRALKRQRTELQNLPSVVREVEAQEAVDEARRQRRKVVREEKASTQPPRLGKQRFEDHSVVVLTSDEVGYGLRQMRPYPMLALERFKSLQKRGLVEPRRPVGEFTARKQVVYEKGARQEKAVAAQEKLQALRSANKVAEKKLVK